jgi:putative transposase
MSRKLEDRTTSGKCRKLHLVSGLDDPRISAFLGRRVSKAVTLNLTTAYKNFFEGRARFPRFKSKHGRQSIGYPQNVKVIGDALKLPGKVGTVKAKIHRPIEGKIKTVTVSKEPSGKYYASILNEVEGENPDVSTEGKIIGIDLGLKHFALF